VVNRITRYHLSESLLQKVTHLEIAIMMSNAFNVFHWIDGSVLMLGTNRTISKLEEVEEDEK
jgi:hypothetical protein